MGVHQAKTAEGEKKEEGKAADKPKGTSMEERRDVSEDLESIVSLPGRRVGKYHNAQQKKFQNGWMIH